MCYIMSRAWAKEKIRSTHEESNLRPSHHRDFLVSEVYYKVHMTRVQHTVGISNVDSVMSVDRNKRVGKF